MANRKVNTKRQKNTTNISLYNLSSNSYEITDDDGNVIASDVSIIPKRPYHVDDDRLNNGITFETLKDSSNKIKTKNLFGMENTNIDDPKGLMNNLIGLNRIYIDNVDIFENRDLESYPHLTSVGVNVGDSYRVILSDYDDYIVRSDTLTIQENDKLIFLTDYGVKRVDEVRMTSFENRSNSGIIIVEMLTDKNLISDIAGHAHSKRVPYVIMPPRSERDRVTVVGTMLQLVYQKEHNIPISNFIIDRPYSHIIINEDGSLDMY
jgi:hypothetical protein